MDYSFKAVYRTKKQNEKVTLFNIPDEVITEMVIDDKKVEPIASYTFPEIGEHTIYSLIDIFIL